MLYFLSSYTNFLIANNESTVVAKPTPSIVTNLNSGPPHLMSNPFSIHPRTIVDKYGVGKYSALRASVKL